MEYNQINGGLTTLAMPRVGWEVGYVLQNLLTVVQRLIDLEKRLRQLEQPPPKPKP